MTTAYSMDFPERARAIVEALPLHQQVGLLLCPDVLERCYAARHELGERET